jgi:hypothetical protein
VLVLNLIVPLILVGDLQVLKQNHLNTRDLLEKCHQSPPSDCVIGQSMEKQIDGHSHAINRVRKMCLV